MKIANVEINWLGHSGFFVKNSKNIYIDPYNIREGLEKADIIFLTHSHYDHCSFADLKKIVHEGTTIVCPPSCQSSITKFDFPIRIELVEPNQEISIGDIKIATLPSYNKESFFHSKSELWVGYLIKFNDILIYHAGDTDLIPEMQKLTGYKQAGKEFVAMLPVGGRFTMNAEEAVEAAKLIKPTIVIPMHYGSVVGNESDAEEFKELCDENDIRCEILEKK
jgi:L-ascorbate metabolism protein UlaG (beta-lactamase superfamily)